MRQSFGSLEFLYLFALASPQKKRLCQKNELLGLFTFGQPLSINYENNSDYMISRSRMPWSGYSVVELWMLQK